MGRQSGKKKTHWRRIFVIVILVAIAAGTGVFVLFRLRFNRNTILKQAEISLQRGDSASALGKYRSLVEKNPKDQKALAGMARALTEQKEYEQALAAIEDAVGNGLPIDQALEIKSRVAISHAAYTLAAAADRNVAAVDRALTEHIYPMVAELENAAKADPDSYQLWDASGDMQLQVSHYLQFKWRLLWIEMRTAAELKELEKAGEIKKAIDAILVDVNDAQQAANGFFEKAMAVKPEAVHPRIVIAQQAVAAYIPRLDEARRVLAPLMERSPAPKEAIEVMTAVERYSDAPEKALDLVESLLERDPENFGYLNLKCKLLMELERWIDAAPVAQKLMQLNPNNNDTRYNFARLLLRRNEPAEAARYLQEIFSDSNMKWPEARLALAKALEQSGNVEQAISACMRVSSDTDDTVFTSARRKQEVYATLMEANQLRLTLMYGRAKAVGATPAEIEELALNRVASIAGRGRDHLDEAIIVCDAALADLKNDPDNTVCLRKARARCLRLKGNYSEALSAYDALLTEFPKDKDLGFELATLHALCHHEDEVGRVFERMLEADPTDRDTLLRLTLWHVSRNENEAARELLGRLEALYGVDAARNLMARLYMREGRMDDAFELVNAQVAANPRDPAAHVMLADILWSQGDLAGAREHFNSSLYLVPNYVPALRRAVLDLQMGKAADAEKLLREAGGAFPNDATIFAGLGVALQSGGKLDEAEALLSKVGNGAPNRSLDAPRRYLAFVLAAQGKKEQAAKVSRLIVETDWDMYEDRVELLNQLAGMDPAERQRLAQSINLVFIFAGAQLTNIAENHLAEVRKSLGESPLLVCWHARLLDLQGKGGEAIAIYQDVLAEHPDFLFGHLILADSLREHGDTPNAISSLEEALLVSGPDHSALINLRLGIMYETQAMLEAADRCYTEAASHPATEALACNNLAYMYANRQNDPVKALPFAERAVELTGEDPGILDTLGWVLYLNKDYATALPHLQKAKERLPNVPTVRYHLGMTLLKLGQKEQAAAELKEALTLSSSFPEAEDARAVLQTI